MQGLSRASLHVCAFNTSPKCHANLFWPKIHAPLTYQPLIFGQQPPPSRNSYFGHNLTSILELHILKSRTQMKILSSTKLLQINLTFLPQIIRQQLLVMSSVAYLKWSLLRFLPRMTFLSSFNSNSTFPLSNLFGSPNLENKLKFWTFEINFRKKSSSTLEEKAIWSDLFIPIPAWIFIDTSYQLKSKLSMHMHMTPWIHLTDSTSSYLA